MKKIMKELQQIKGVGEILAKRFIRAGYDSFDRIAAAEEAGLKSIQGINPQTIPSIIRQAAAMAAEKSAERARQIAELKAAAAAIREQVDGLGRACKKRVGEDLQGKSGKKVAAELLKTVTALEKAEAKMEKRVKRAGKGLAKAGQRLSGLTADTGAVAMSSSLKKARKSLKRIYA
jgi:NAD-dependent DNA ligase